MPDRQLSEEDVARIGALFPRLRKEVAKYAIKRRRYTDVDDFISIAGLAICDGWHREPNPYALKADDQIVAIAIGVVRHKMSDQKAGLDVSIQDVPASLMPSEPPAEAYALRVDLEQAINELPKAQRAVIRLRTDGWTHRKIADHVGVSENTEKTHMRRARTTLRARLLVEDHCSRGGAVKDSRVA